MPGAVAPVAVHLGVEADHSGLGGACEEGLGGTVLRKVAAGGGGQARRGEEVREPVAVPRHGRREAFADAVRRVAVVAEPNSPIRLDFSARGTVLLQAGYEDDIAPQRLPATLSHADDLTVAFNPAYVLDALNSPTASRVRWELLGPGQRALLSGIAAEEDTALQDHRHLLISVRQLS